MRIKRRFAEDEVFFTSDLHFNHAGIIDLCGRPFTDRDDMAHQLITNWNSVVDKDQTVIDEGDFAWTGNIDFIKDLRSQLNGNILKVYGNHDYQNKFDRQVIQDIFGGTIYDILEIEIDNPDLEEGFSKVFNCHYPLYEWNRGAVHAHGHCHTKGERVIEFNPFRYDVGVDNNNYKPVSWLELKEIINYQVFNNKRK